MKIISLKAENVKRLRAVEIEPKGAVVQITGRNAQGKSSVLDAIFYALAGGKELPAKPIRNGEEKAVIRLDLGEIVVTRRFTPTGSTLTVEGANGARFPSPQRMLDDLIGAISFDPLAFSRMDPKHQADMLRKVVPLDVDIDALDGQNKRDFEARTEVNRKAKALRAQAAGIAVPPDLPEEAVDVSALMDEMAAAADRNGDIERRAANREAAADTIKRSRADADEREAAIGPRIAEIEKGRDRVIADAEAEIARLKARIESARTDADRDIAAARQMLQDEAAALRAKADELQGRLDAAAPLDERVDVEDLRRRIDAASSINAGIAARENRRKVEKEAEAAEAESAALTAAMEARAKEKQDAIRRAAMPVDGLGFGDGEILYRGLPFAQASSAEQLRVSVAIAAAANPKLRVILVRDGSLLDADGLALLAEIATEKDLQVFLERVDSSGRIGIVIEDGTVAAVNVDEPAQPQLAMGV